MSDPSLQQLELDVEAARAKLAGDLTTLQSPATYTEFSSGLKEEALDMKDALVEKAKWSVQSKIDEFVKDLKGRAAANPAAALAIGAGIAWRLIRHPPIATALVGVGLYSLFRTPPMQTTWLTDEEYFAQGKQRLAGQASEFAEAVKDRAVAIGEAAAEKTSEVAERVKDRALALGEIEAEKANELTRAAKDQAQLWRAQAPSSTQQRTATAATATSDGNLEEMRRSAANETARLSRPSLQETLGSQVLANQESRDSLLLGAAGLAVVAALGVACQRRLREPEEVD